MFFWAVLTILILPENGIQGGILYPRTSEARETLTLDGIWRFVIANRSEQHKGFEEQWFQRPLQQVNYFNN